MSSVSNGQEGLKSIEDMEPDIILLDLRMPDMSGIEVLKNIRQIKKTLPVVMLTTSDDEKDLIEALRNGASGYLLKDMEPDDLVVALKDVLKGETIVAPNLVQILAKFHQGASISSVFNIKIYKPLGRLSALLAICLLTGGLMVLVLDLGRPDRLVVAMTTFNFKSIFA